MSGHHFFSREEVEILAGGKVVSFCVVSLAEDAKLQKLIKMLFWFSQWALRTENGFANPFDGNVVTSIVVKRETRAAAATDFLINEKCVLK